MSLKKEKVKKKVKTKKTSSAAVNKLLKVGRWSINTFKSTLHVYFAHKRITFFLFKKKRKFAELIYLR